MGGAAAAVGGASPATAGTPSGDRQLLLLLVCPLADCLLLSGPPGLELDGADRAVATVTGLRAGAYRFRLTVVDQQGATDSSVLSVRVLQSKTGSSRQPGQPVAPWVTWISPPLPPSSTAPPPVAHASGSHTLTLPNNSLVLRGSVTHGDQTQVRYLWVRDRQSPAAGVRTGQVDCGRGRSPGVTDPTLSCFQDVLFSSDRQPSLYLSNLVQGTYLFQLQVTDARGRSSSAAATVEVRPGGRSLLGPPPSALPGCC